MITTLQTLPQAFKESSNERIAKWVIKYQKYSVKAALKYAPEGPKKSTLTQYMTNCLMYLKTGKQIKSSAFLYPFLDKLIQQHVQPLTPSDGEKRREIKKDYTKKEITPPIAELKIVKRPLTAKVIYGIRFDDTIKIFDSEEEAKGFNKGMIFAGKDGGKVVTVELGEP